MSQVFTTLVLSVGPTEVLETKVGVGMTTDVYYLGPFLLSPYEISNSFPEREITVITRRFEILPILLYPSIFTSPILLTLFYFKN